MRMVAIGSGKGGVGKTWFAVTLSHALADFGKRTLLVDADTGLANVDVQLGLEKGANLGSVLMGKRPFAASIQAVPELDFDVLAGRPGCGGLGPLDQSAAERLVGELRLLRDSYELIVLDLPTGLDQSVRRLMLAADEAVIMTTEEPTALTDAYALIKAMHRQKPGLLPRIIVNLAEDHEAGERTFDGLSRVCTRFLELEPPFSRRHSPR